MPGWWRCGGLAPTASAWRTPGWKSGGKQNIKKQREIQMENNIQEVLISQAQIEERVSQLARELSREYAGKNPVFVGVLKGVVMFFADMVKHITVPCQIDFMCISSYSGTESTGTAVV